MNSTQVLLSKIAALRQRIAPVEGSLSEADKPGGDKLTSRNGLDLLERKIASGSQEISLLDGSIRQLPGAVLPVEDRADLPVRLTARGARLLQRGRDLLQGLRRLAEEPFLENQADPLAILHRETAAMLDSVLRTVQAFPQLPSAQTRLCDGLEVVLGEVADRLTILTSGLDHRRAEDARIASLAASLQRLVRGETVTLHSFLPLAEFILEAAKQGLPLRFVHADPGQPARHIACHSLIVAQVMARLIGADNEWQGRLHEPILAALLHDVGMLHVPAEILKQTSPLNDAQRRLVESHTSAGADILSRLMSTKNWLVEAAACHHERIDGTGYPNGLRGPELSPLVRLLMVCDIYAALCGPRAYRSALETRTALTDTLLLAEQGAIDQLQAERLLDLSFYPVGSVVELTDGAVGVVVASHPARKDLHSPSRPVLALLTEPQGQPLPFPCHLDLTHFENRSILRALPAAERMELLVRRYPELVC
jgi:HD-GYP domain-containing protein (c-di-GMP phosphodiesterase class II)